MPLLKVCCLTRSYDLAHTPVEPKVWKNSKKKYRSLVLNFHSFISVLVLSRKGQKSGIIKEKIQVMSGFTYMYGNNIKLFFINLYLKNAHRLVSF